MDCLRPQDGNDYLKWFVGKATAERTPLAGTLELTARCNLRCVHCYLGSLRGPRALGPAPARELGTARIRGLLDEMVEAGCLQLLITGGEPLLRPDFAEVYRHARERGLLMGVFTNGTLVDAATCSLFRELPPETVEVTLYGVTAATYEAITQVEGSYARCVAGIERLLHAGVRVALKTVLLTANVHEFDAMRALARSYDVPFRYDAAVSAALDGDRSPVAFRLPVAQAIELELADGLRMGQWRKRGERHRENTGPHRLYGCGAGVNAFFIDATARLYPCLMARSVSYDVSGGGFFLGWRDTIPKVHELAPGKTVGCVTCPARPFCDTCPGFVALETGAEDGRSEFLCRTAWARRDAVGVEG